MVCDTSILLLTRITNAGKLRLPLTLPLIYAVTVSFLMPDTVFSCQSSKADGIKVLTQIFFQFAKEKQKAPLGKRKEIITATCEKVFR